MKIPPFLCLCLFLGSPLSAPAAEVPPPVPPEAAKPLLPTQEGTWKPIAAVMSGVRLPEAALQAITLKIPGDQYEVTVTGEAEPDRGSCVLDLTTTPKRMTITSTSGPNKGKTFLAIYEMKNAESLRVC